MAAADPKRTFIRAQLALICLFCAAVSNTSYSSEVETLRISLQSRCAEHQVNVSSGVGLRIVEKPFHPEEHLLIFDKDQRNVIATIDGRKPYGISRSRLPACQVEVIELSVKNMKYKLESTGMFDAIMNKPDSISLLDRISVQCSPVDPVVCVIRGLFSDAAGTFAAEWNIDYGVAERSVLSNDEDILELFREQKLPPEYE